MNTHPDLCMDLATAYRCDHLLAAERERQTAGLSRRGMTSQLTPSVRIRLVGRMIVGRHPRLRAKPALTSDADRPRALALLPAWAALLSRGSLLLVLCALSLVVASPLTTSPAEAKRGKARRTITRTFTEPDSLTMGAGNTQDRMFPYPSTIEVYGFKKGPVRDVDVVLRRYQHDAPDDLDLLLVAPNGRNAIVMSDVGGDNATTEDLTITLDDAAGAMLPDDDPLASGAYRPANIGLGDAFLTPAPAPSGSSALAAFNGGDPNGTWQLFVVDDDSGNVGSIFGGWELLIKAKTKPQGDKK